MELLERMKHLLVKTSAWFGSHESVDRETSVNEPSPFVSQAQELCAPAGSAWRPPAAPRPAWLFSSWALGRRCRARTWSWWEPDTACRWSRRDSPQVMLIVYVNSSRCEHIHTSHFNGTMSSKA